MNWWWLPAWLMGQVFGAWFWPAVFCRALKRTGRRSSLYAAWRDETRPFAPYALALGALCQYKSGRFDASDWVVFGVAAIAWWVMRNDKDDDDRWKRRRKRLASKVAEVGGRLQVVPAGAES